MRLNNVDSTQQARSGRASLLALWLVSLLLIGSGAAINAGWLGTPMFPTSGATKAIQDIEVGEVVYAKDPSTGEIAPKQVVRVFRNTADHLRILRIRSIGTDSVQEFQTTDEHPFWVPAKGWVDAGDLQVGDEVEQSDNGLAVVVLTEYEAHPEGVPVYNFETEDFHTYYVAAHGSRGPPVLVHNCNPPARASLSPQRGPSTPQATPTAPSQTKPTKVTPEKSPSPSRSGPPPEMVAGPDSSQQGWGRPGGHGPLPKPEFDDVTGMPREPVVPKRLQEQQQYANSPSPPADEMLYRGVPGGTSEKARLGREGIAKPRGTALDSESLRKHVLGEDVDAGVTSWTPSRSQAKRWSGKDGVIIEVPRSKIQDSLVPRPNVGKYAEELEVLIRGAVQGTATKP